MSIYNRYVVCVIFVFLLGNNYSIYAGADKKASEWHIISATASSTPAYIEKSKDPLFGKKRKRKEYKTTATIEAQKNVTATSTNLSISKSKNENEMQLRRPRRTEFSVIDNTCHADENYQKTTFYVCNEEPYSVIILEHFKSPYARLIEPTLPITVKPDHCEDLSFTGIEKRPFDCSGIYALSFKTQIMETKQTGYFSASIVE